MLSVSELIKELPESVDYKISETVYGKCGVTPDVFVDKVLSGEWALDIIQRGSVWPVLNQLRALEAMAKGRSLGEGIMHELYPGENDRTTDFLGEHTNTAPKYSLTDISQRGRITLQAYGHPVKQEDHSIYRRIFGFDPLVDARGQSSKFRFFLRKDLKSKLPHNNCIGDISTVLNMNYREWMEFKKQFLKRIVIVSDEELKLITHNLDELYAIKSTGVFSLIVYSKEVTRAEMCEIYFDVNETQKKMSYGSKVAGYITGYYSEIRKSVIDAVTATYCSNNFVAKFNDTDFYTMAVGMAFGIEMPSAIKKAAILKTIFKDDDKVSYRLEEMHRCTKELTDMNLLNDFNSLLKTMGIRHASLLPKKTTSAVYAYTLYCMALKTFNLDLEKTRLLIGKYLEVCYLSHIPTTLGKNITDATVKLFKYFQELSFEAAILEFCEPFWQGDDKDAEVNVRKDLRNSEKGKGSMERLLTSMLVRTGAFPLGDKASKPLSSYYDECATKGVSPDTVLNDDHIVNKRRLKDVGIPPKDVNCILNLVKMEYMNNQTKKRDKTAEQYDLECREVFKTYNRLRTPEYKELLESVCLWQNYHKDIFDEFGKVVPKKYYSFLNTRGELIAKFMLSEKY